MKYIRRSFCLRINIIYVWHTQYKKYSHIKQNLHKYPWTYSHNQISSLWNIFVFRIMSYILCFITLWKRYYVKPCGTGSICYLIGLGTKVVTYMSPSVSKHTQFFEHYLQPFINLIIFNFIPWWIGHRIKETRFSMNT